MSRFRTVLTAVSIALLSLPATAAAANQYSAQQGYSCNAGSWGAGQADANGTVYVACGGHVSITEYEGGTRHAAIPNGVNDIAPSPDGAFLYMRAGNDIRRMNRQADGTYVLDSVWRVAQFPYGGAPRNSNGFYLSTDAAGNIYVANGIWSRDFEGAGAYSTIAKYAPDGSFITRFGDSMWDDNLRWTAGYFKTLGSVAVTRDGSMAFATDVHNGRVHRFIRQANGEYAPDLAWGNTAATQDPDVGICYSPNDPDPVKAARLSAPYNLETDPWNNVYVTNTSCQEVRKFDVNGRFLALIGGLSSRNHGVAPDGHGNVISGEQSQISRVDADGGPRPGVADTQAPTIGAVSVPNPTSTVNVTLTVTAADDRGIAMVRTANGGENINGAAWVAYSGPAVGHVLPAGDGDKVIQIQVADLRGNVSAPSAVQTRLVTPGTGTGTGGGGTGGGGGGGTGGGFNGIDRVKPTLLSARAPRTTRSRSVRIALKATDNRKVTHVRFSFTKNGITKSRWVPFSKSVAFRIRNTRRTQTIYVQVRDARGNLSGVKKTTTRYTPRRRPARAGVAVAAPAPAAPVEAAPAPQQGDGAGGLL